MKNLRSIFESFNSDTYLDYLSVYIEESEIQFMEQSANFLYIVARLDDESRLRIKEYLSTSPRFKDTVVLSQSSPKPFGVSDSKFDAAILIVDKDFYNRNIQYLYKNIKFKTHPIVEQLAKIAEESPEIISGILRTYKGAKMAVGLPNGFSIIKNLSSPAIEFMVPEFSEPLIFNPKDPVDIVYLQYSLYKYMCK